MSRTKKLVVNPSDPLLTQAVTATDENKSPAEQIVQSDATLIEDTALTQAVTVTATDLQDLGSGPEQPSSLIAVIMTQPMTGIEIDWPVSSEQWLLPVPAFRLVQSGNAKFKSESDSENARNAFEAFQLENLVDLP